MLWEATSPLVLLSVVVRDFVGKSNRCHPTTTKCNVHNSLFLFNTPRGEFFLRNPGVFIRLLFILISPTICRTADSLTFTSLLRRSLFQQHAVLCLGSRPRLRAALCGRSQPLQEAAQTWRAAPTAPILAFSQHRAVQPRPSHVQVQQCVREL